jgi:hypothetical protein
MNLSRYYRSIGRSFTGLLLAVSASTCDAANAQKFTEIDSAQPFGHCLFGAFPAGYFQGKALTSPATAPIMAIHPDNPKLRIAAFAQDQDTVDFANPFARKAGGPVLASSQDGGYSWKLINDQFLKGSFQSYTVRAITFAKGDGSQGTILVHGDFTQLKQKSGGSAQCGVYVCSSVDGGKTWTYPQVIATGEALVSQEYEGFSVDGGDLVYDSYSGNNLYQTYTTTASPTTFFGDIYFAKSTDLGHKWTQPKKIYTVTHDFFTKFNRLGGGQCVAPSLAVIKQNQKKAIVNAFLRIYPDNNNCYSQNIGGDQSGIDPTNSSCSALDANSIYDRALVRSVDDGNTWDTHATLVAPQDFSRFATAFDPRARDRVGVHPFDSSLGTQLAVDDNSSIMYMVWQAGHNSEVRELAEQPQIWLSLSKDLGVSWTMPVVVSQTSNSFSTKTADSRDQAFGPKVYVTDDGMIGITYYDYRNSKKGSAVVATDAWLAEYKLSADGNGVEFIKEARLTAQSFDSSPSFDNFATKAN